MSCTPDDATMLGPAARAKGRQDRPGLLRRLHLALRDRLPDEWVVRRNYFHRFGVYPDLNNPQTLSEKVTWLKLHGATPLHRRCADKIAVRDWVAARVGPEVLNRAILITENPADITPDVIPDRRFVVKANMDTGSVLLCHDRARFDWDACRARMAEALARPFWRIQRERQYRGIRPAIIVEHMLDPDDPAIGLTDHRILCLHGEPQFVEVTVVPPGALYCAVYSLDWVRLPIQVMAEASNSAVLPFELPRPGGLDRMLDIARRLSAPFPLVRVDLYETGRRVVFGELTFTPSAGLERIEARWPAPGADPRAEDRAWGAHLDMDRTRAQLAALRGAQS